MYKILLNISDHTACSYYRSVLPWSYCHEQLRDEGIQLDISENINRNYDYDCYIFHRVLNSNFFPTLYDMKRCGKKIVWDTDDDLLSIPEWSPANEMRKAGRVETFLTCLEWADVITLTTKIFAEHYGKNSPWRDKIQVLPNLISLNDWNFPLEIRRYGPIRIMWSGSLTHEKDIDLVSTSVEEIIKEYEDKVKFIFMGMMPKSLRLTPEKMGYLKNRVCFVPPCELPYYAANMRLLLPDIAMVPVVDCPFNQCKSNIKYLEFTMAGAAVIASPVGPYRETILDGENGILSGNDNWKSSILGLMEDRNRISDIRYSAWKNVTDNYTWQSDAREIWLKFFRGLVQ